MDEASRKAFQIHYGTKESARGATVVDEESFLTIDTIEDVKADLSELLEAVTGRSIDGDIAVFGMERRTGRNEPVIGRLETFTNSRQLHVFLEKWAPYTPHL